MNNDTKNLIYTGQQLKKQACVNNLKDILYQAKQSIDAKNQLQWTGTLSKTFQEYVEEANPY